MGKKKNKNKVSGAIKTAAKTEKKLANKLRKELANLGEDDIAKVIAEIEREEAKRAAPVEKTLKDPPKPRAYASLTPHPTNNELIMFGGEYHDGQKTEVYNELLFYNAVNNTWRQVKAPGAPPPRSAHQAVSTQANRGELWIFGGEFTSPSETQFHHYKDLWCFSLSDKKWEKVVSPNGPSSRSGHRMALLGRKLFTFGGYNDDGRDCRYYDDLYSFCLDTRIWTKLAVSGRGPSPRSACIMLPIGNDSLFVYGGYSRAREGRTERTYTHTDGFRLVQKGDSWLWRAVGSSTAPPARAGQAAAVGDNASKGYVFGGVSDTEETEEDIHGDMSDDLHQLDLETGRWRQVVLKEARVGVSHAEPETTSNDARADDEEVTVVQDEVFTLKLGAAPIPSSQPQTVETAHVPGPAQRPGGPSPRMSAMMAIQRSQLYIYGGVLERDDKQFYLSDMYSLDLHKLNKWETIIAQPALPEWLGSDSDVSGSETGSDSETDTSSEAEE